jgi:hypothetical protein
VTFGQIAIDTHEAHLLDAQSLALHAAQDLAGQAAANPVGLHDDQRRFLGHARS